MRPKGNAKELEARRRRAIALLERGWGIRETAREVGSSPSSVVYWKNLVKKGGTKALVAEPHPRRPSRLSVGQKKELLELLLEGTIAFGYASQLWTLPRIAKVIEEHLGITYHPAHIWKILQSLGWSCQRPQRRAREQNQKEVKQWRHQTWPHIKKR